MTTDATTAWEALTLAHTAMTRDLTDLLDLHDREPGGRKDARDREK